MKTTVLATASTLAMIATAAAHPGHDHSNLSTPEFAWHHLLTGGFVGVAAISVAWFGYQAFKKRRELATNKIEKR